MACPNCSIELTEANEKINFEDSDGNTKYIKVTAEWCLECGYEFVH